MFDAVLSGLEFLCKVALLLVWLCFWRGIQRRHNGLVSWRAIPFITAASAIVAGISIGLFYESGPKIAIHAAKLFTILLVSAIIFSFKEQIKEKLIEWGWYDPDGGTRSYQKIPEKLTLEFHYDFKHAWLKIPTSLIHELNIFDEITEFSVV